MHAPYINNEIEVVLTKFIILMLKTNGDVIGGKKV